MADKPASRAEADPEFWQLLAALCDDTLTAPQRDRLEAILSADLEAQVLAAAYLDQHAQMLWLYRDAAETADEPAPAALRATADEQPTAAAAQAPAGRSPVLGFLGACWHSVQASPRTLGLALGGVLVGYFVVMFALIPLARWMTSAQLNKADAAAATRPVGKLQASAESRWEHGAVPPTDVKIGERCGLNDGRVVIRLARGTSLVIEAPARWQFESAQRLQFDEGRIAAHVPRSAVGFAIVTPCAEIVDLGTEFGVDVASDGQTEVHVVQGKVAVRQSRSASKTAPQAIQLGRGEALRVTAATGTANVAFDGLRFGSAFDAAARAAASDQTAERVTTIWLGNLFDDRPGTPLAQAMQTDTYKASPTFNNTLGVATVVYGGDGRSDLAPGIPFDLTSLDWRAGMLFLMANDAWTERNLQEPPGGLRLSGQQMPYVGPKIEDGIGMFGSSLITFDLDELRAAGNLPGCAFEFKCDSAGLNDGSINVHGAGTMHLAVLVSSADGVETALVDGQQMPVVQRDGRWRIDAPLGPPLRPGGPYVSFEAHLAPRMKYLTLISSATGDGDAYDHGTWIRPRLEVVER